MIIKWKWCLIHAFEVVVMSSWWSRQEEVKRMIVLKMVQLNMEERIHFGIINFFSYLILDVDVVIMMNDDRWRQLMILTGRGWSFDDRMGGMGRGKMKRWKNDEGMGFSSFSMQLIHQHDEHDDNNDEHHGIMSRIIYFMDDNDSMHVVERMNEVEQGMNEWSFKQASSTHLRGCHHVNNHHFS